MTEESPAVWQRPYHVPQAGTASVVLFAFSERPLDLSTPLSRSRHGLPSQFSIHELDIRQHRRADNPEWFDGFFSPDLLHLAALDIGETIGLSQMTAVCSVRFEVQEPPELAYLQGCWAATKWLCDCGARFVHDAHAIRWHNGANVLALNPLREFDIEHEIKVVFETEETPDFGYTTHTRGLAKFGRPDVVLAGVQPAVAQVCGVLLNALAKRAALGAALRVGQTVAPANLAPRNLIEYEPERRHPQVHLNNDGLVLNVADWGLRDL